MVEVVYHEFHFCKEWKITKKRTLITEADHRKWRSRYKKTLDSSKFKIHIVQYYVLRMYDWLMFRNESSYHSSRNDCLLSILSCYSVFHAFVIDSSLHFGRWKGMRSETMRFGKKKMPGVSSRVTRTRRIHLKFKELSWNERQTIRGIYFMVVFFDRSASHHLLCESLLGFQASFCLFREEDWCKECRWRFEDVHLREYRNKSNCTDELSCGLCSFPVLIRLESLWQFTWKGRTKRGTSFKATTMRVVEPKSFFSRQYLRDFDDCLFPRICVACLFYVLCSKLSCRLR